MAIGFGSDHWGMALKNRLVQYFGGLGFESVDFGVNSSEPADYPDIAGRMAAAVRDGVISNGVLVCRTGLGMAIAANKVRGVFAATVHNLATARAAAASNAVQIITIGAQFVSFHGAKRIVTTWLATPFKGGDSARKVGKIQLLEASAQAPVTRQQMEA